MRQRKALNPTPAPIQSSNRVPVLPGDLSTLAEFPDSFKPPHSTHSTPLVPPPQSALSVGVERQRVTPVAGGGVRVTRMSHDTLTHVTHLTHVHVRHQSVDGQAAPVCPDSRKRAGRGRSAVCDGRSDSNDRPAWSRETTIEL